MSINPVGRVVKEIRGVEAIAGNIVGDVGADPLVLPCIKAYVLNSIALPITSEKNVCRGKDVDAEGLVSRVGKVLSGKISVLTSVCSMYRDLLSSSTRAVVDIGCGLGLNLNVAGAYAEALLLIGA